MIKFICLMLFIAAFSGAAESAQADKAELLGPIASKSLKSLALALAENEKIKVASDLKAMVQAKKELKKQVDALLSAKELDRANAVNEEMKKIDFDISKMTEMGDVDPKIALVGQWITTDTSNPVQIKFNSDATVNAWNGMNGKYAIEGRIIIMTLQDGKYTFSIDDQGIIKGTTPSGVKFQAKKIKILE